MDAEVHVWDIFISHASEDKDHFVRPLATELRRLGLRVWYDEFTLRIGDSLSASIDRGLSKSDAGLVIVSHNFMAKRWPQRELAGLVAGNMGREQPILPIWLNVSRDEVLAFSPTLADTVAIDATSLDLDDLALQILEQVKPELHTAILRRHAFDQAVASADIKYVNTSDLKKPPIRHDSFPTPFANRIRLVREILLEVYPRSWHFWIDGFQRDMHPDDELAIWEKLASVYVTVVNEFGLDLDGRRDLFSVLCAKISVEAGKPWELTYDAPLWKVRAHALYSDRINPHSEDFGSRAVFPPAAKNTSVRSH